MSSYLPSFLLESAIFLLVLLFPSVSIFAQDTTDLKHIYEAVHIDPIIVAAARFDVKDFIDMVEKDETFYVAFSNLRHIYYKATNNINFFNKKSINIASYYSQTLQSIDNDGCRSMKVLEESSSGKYYERNSEEPQYYTAKMYNKLFFTQGIVCPTEKKNPNNKNSNMESHINELKKLIFAPGKKTNVPIIGNKTAIFSPKMTKYYNYAIEQKIFNGLDCHVFIAKVKDEYSTRKEDKTVIKHLETYFEKGTHQVVARAYELEFHGIFSLSIKMKIEVKKLNDNFYVPTKITYDGYWNVPLKAMEKCKFEMYLEDFYL